MKPEEYKQMYEVEDSYWWHVGMRKIFFTLIKTHLDDLRSNQVLDAGCGTGIVLQNLKRYSNAIGIDYSLHALNLARKRGQSYLLRASVTDLPFKTESFEMIVSFDVIYHRGVEDDIAALKEFCRTLRKGGRLLLNLPAYEFLRSEHDEAIYTKRRYTKKDLIGKIEKAGLKVERISYWNSLLFPLLAFFRLIKRICKRGEAAESHSDLEHLPSFLNLLLTYVLYSENWFLKYINFPYGLSILAVAQKH